MFSGLKILYLEDEPLVAFDTTEHLDTLGFETVTSVQRLAKAQTAAKAAEFDLAVLDINVDNGNTSLELGDALRKAGTTVLFASGNSFEESRLTNQGFYFLNKPFSLNALTEKLHSMVQTAA